jgi:hypothetical protein
MLLDHLESRGIIGADLDKSMQQIVSVLHTSQDFVTKRTRVEQFLRRLVFAHRRLFPELQSSTVVQFWEHITGQKWL